MPQGAVRRRLVVVHLLTGLAIGAVLIVTLFVMAGLASAKADAAALATAADLRWPVALALMLFVTTLTVGTLTMIRAKARMKALDPQRSGRV